MWPIRTISIEKTLTTAAANRIISKMELVPRYIANDPGRATDVDYLVDDGTPDHEERFFMKPLRQSGMHRNNHTKTTMAESEKLIPKHGGYRKLKSFQVSQLLYDISS